MGENEERMFLDKGVEVGGFGIDAGAFDLDIDKKVCPKVIAYLHLVLTKEHPDNRVIAVGFESRVVTYVGSDLGVQHVVKKFEVGIDRILAGKERNANLVLIAAVLQVLLHVVVQPPCDFEIEVDTPL